MLDPQPVYFVKSARAGFSGAIKRGAPAFVATNLSDQSEMLHHVCNRIAMIVSSAATSAFAQSGFLWPLTKGVPVSSIVKYGPDLRGSCQTLFPQS